MIVHKHNKYAIKIMDSNISTIMMPSGKNFNLDILNRNGLQVYLNGALQVCPLHYNEIIDPLDDTKGVGIDFYPEALMIDDVILLEWPIEEIE